MNKSSKEPAAVHVILGNQLFPAKLLADEAGLSYFMAEDVGLCTYVRHHKKKILLFLAAMRCYAEELEERGLDLRYERLAVSGKKDASYEEKLAAEVKRRKAERLVIWEIEDKFFEQRIEAFAEEHGLELEVRESPMFVTTREQFAEYAEGVKKPFMATFYQRQRKRLDVLMDDSGKPEGGQWSFDAENRKKLPKGVELPEISTPDEKQHVTDVRELVKQRFADHPGDDGELMFPVTRRQALAWLDKFLEERFELFGDYEDALSTRGDVLFHSVLSPMMNLGLLTPKEILERALAAADERGTPMNAVEGFVRQVIGWREFIRGIYQRHSEEQEKANFFDHRRKLTEHWYEGDTGIPPLDDAIKKAWRLGWCHHIERLMVLSNLMNLCQIEPKEAHRWFMEMFVDSSDWVMGPNVYGMGLFSDGGIFSTKPYVCGSNYLLKMSDYGKGDWCDVVDGLYWGFIDRHRDYFSGNPRLSVMTRSLDKLKGERKERIYSAAERFMKRCTKKG
ncbi:cryptochrome/photolyase family protein [Mucisphaera sp.]|uniref:cryptochrome/photolyase family protein n=1 Tax=Mucisphaera sp. TaxID=2913024 RepID=UPI003D1046A4